MPAEQRPLLSTMPHVYAIAGWSELFETADSRKTPRPLEWVKTPTQHDRRGYMRVMGLPNRDAVYLAWCLMVQEAALMPCRGVFAHLGGPLDASDLAEKTRLRKPNAFRAAMTELIKPEIGWLLKLTWDSELQFWENIHQLGLTPTYVERREADTERRRRTRHDTGRQQADNTTRNHSTNGNEPRDTGRHGTTPHGGGGGGLDYITVEDSRRENLSFSPDRELSADELRSLLIDLTKKSFAGAPLTSADFQNREKDLWLEQALPITFAGVDALRWFYTLPVSHEVFKTTARVQSAEQLLRKLKNEVGKALTLRPQFVEPTPPPVKKEPPQWREFFRARYGEECRLPATFWDLGPDLREEWDLEHKEVAA
jgi:hypothetical protein